MTRQSRVSECLALVTPHSSWRNNPSNTKRRIVTVSPISLLAFSKVFWRRISDYMLLFKLACQKNLGLKNRRFSLAVLHLHFVPIHTSQPHRQQLHSKICKKECKNYLLSLATSFWCFCVCLDWENQKKKTCHYSCYMNSSNFK